MSASDSVLVRLEGGLGNQMFQYAAGRSVALRTGRELVLDPAAIPRGISRRSYELRAFRIGGRLARPLERLATRCQVGSRIPRLVRMALRAVSPRRWQILADPGRGFDNRLFVTPGNLVLQGLWQCVEYLECDADVSCRLRNDFQLRQPLPAVAESVVAEITHSEAVCVHVRRGDYATDPRVAAIHGALPADYHAAAAATIARRVAAPKFFVFSDDLDWAETHLRLPGPARFVREAHGLSPAVDLSLMASCQHFVVANSTFSWWAGWLGVAADKIVVVPRQWFAAAPIPAALVPGGWEVL